MAVARQGHTLCYVWVLKTWSLEPGQACQPTLRAGTAVEQNQGDWLNRYQADYGMWRSRHRDWWRRGASPHQPLQEGGVGFGVRLAREGIADVEAKVVKVASDRILRWQSSGAF